MKSTKTALSGIRRFSHARKTSPIQKGNQMTGVKGRSGGARLGAGRKPKTKPAASPNPEMEDGKQREPLEFLEMVMNNPLAPLKDRIRAAVAAAQYRHTKLHDGGKKEEAAAKAKKAAASDRFRSSSPPLALVRASSEGSR